MIYVDMKFFHERKSIDLRVDDTVTVLEILKVIERVFFIKEVNSLIVSVNRKEILCKHRTLAEQGVQGGDTLILFGGV